MLVVAPVLSATVVRREALAIVVTPMIDYEGLAKQSFFIFITTPKFVI
jgi:hypothetical protein